MDAMTLRRMAQTSPMDGEFLDLGGGIRCIVTAMARAHLLLPALLLLACASTTSSTTNAPSLRATSGPVVVPSPITAEPDRDGDRVRDGIDLCPDQAGSLRDGCPVVDTDRDGISDVYDKCPLAPEPRHGHADKFGCPLNPLPVATPPAATPPAAPGALPVATPPAAPPAATPPAAAPATPPN